MAYVYKDIDGHEHELYDEITAEEVIDITSGEVIGYVARGGYSDYRISKETYEAIIKKRGNGPDLVKIKL